MNQIRILALALMIAPAVWGDASLSGSCHNGGTYPNCVGGEVVFTGSGYSGQIHVRVTNRSGEVIDDGDYTTSNGILRFVENLSFADTYTISVNDQAVLTVTTD